MSVYSIQCHSAVGAVQALSASGRTGFVMLMFLDGDDLEAAGMGFMFTNVTGMSLIIGFGSGAIPLMSQAFGAGNLQRCGDLLQRYANANVRRMHNNALVTPCRTFVTQPAARSHCCGCTRQLLMHAALSVLIVVLWVNTEAILLALGQPTKIAALTHQFVLWRVPSLPALVVQQDYSNFLVAQQVMKPQMWIAVAVNAVNVLAFPLAVSWLRADGAPISLTLFNWVQAMLQCVVTKWYVEPEAWPSWSCSAAAAGWAEVLHLAVPSALCMWTEWWGWEATLFMAGVIACKLSLVCWFL